MKLRPGVVAMLVVAQLGVVAPADAASIPTLRATTILAGDRSATMRVRVPRDAVIDLTPTPDDSRRGAYGPAALDVSGGSGHVGFALTSSGTLDDVAVVAVRTPRQLVDGSRRLWAIAQGGARGEDASSPRSCVRCSIPAGVYDLQLLTRNRAATVTLTIEGLTGRQRLAPTTRAWSHGWSTSMEPGTYEPQSVLPWEGGGMGFGIMWYDRADGLFLAAYQLDLNSEAAGVITAEVCRRVGRGTSSCDGTHVLAGRDMKVAGAGLERGYNARTIMTEMMFDNVGRAKLRAHFSLLWVTVP